MKSTEDVNGKYILNKFFTDYRYGIFKGTTWVI